MRHRHTRKKRPVVSTIGLGCIGIVCLLPALTWGQASKVQVLGEVLAGPAAGADTAAWLKQMQEWRQTHRAAIVYDGAEYIRPELAWGQRSFIQPLMMVEERYF